jgi:hypothetical protein
MRAANVVEPGSVEYEQALAQLRGERKRLHKYNAEPFVDADGVRWDSQAEFRRWGELQMLDRAGEISQLRRQAEYLLVPGRPAGKYRRARRHMTMIWDFSYVETSEAYPCGRVVVEDYKGHPTRDWLNKRKMFEERYPDVITRVTGEQEG